MQRTMTKKASLAAFIASVALLLAFCMPSAAFAADQGVYRDSYNLIDVSNPYTLLDGSDYAAVYLTDLPSGTYTWSNTDTRFTRMQCTYSDGTSKHYYNYQDSFAVPDGVSLTQFGVFFNNSEQLHSFLGSKFMFNSGDTLKPYEEYGKKYFNTAILTKPFEQLGAWCFANAAKVIPFACIVMGIAILILVIVRRYKKMVK